MCFPGPPLLLEARTRASAPSISASIADVAVREGSGVDLGGRIFDIGCELGRGAYGVVWEAVERSSGEDNVVAVKVSHAVEAAGVSDHQRTRETLRLLTECQVLRRLNQELRKKDAEAARHVPQYFAHSATSGKVAFAMTKIEGHPLDCWMYGQHGSLENRGHSHSLNFADACGVATALLSQMVPVFSVLHSFAFHRDICGHNFIIGDSSVEAGPMFTMVDFGFAVKAPTWRDEWREGNIVGDTRYWSPGHWTQFCVGAERMEQLSPALARLYRERSDHYAFGILLLELAFELWEGPSRGKETLDAVVEAHSCWQILCSHNITLFKMFQDNRCDGDRLRAYVMSSGLHSALREANRRLCGALRVAVEAQRTKDPGSELAPLLLVAVELIDPASSLSWDQVPEVLRGGPAPPPITQHPLSVEDTPSRQRVAAEVLQRCNSSEGARQHHPAAAEAARHLVVRSTSMGVVRAVSVGRRGGSLSSGGQIEARVCRHSSTQSPALVSYQAHLPRNVSREASWRHPSPGFPCNPHVVSRSISPCRVDPRDFPTGPRFLPTGRGCEPSCRIATMRGLPLMHAAIAAQGATSSVVF